MTNLFLIDVWSNLLGAFYRNLTERNVDVTIGRKRKARRFREDEGRSARSFLPDVPVLSAVTKQNYRRDRLVASPPFQAHFFKDRNDSISRKSLLQKQAWSQIARLNVEITALSVY